MMNTNTSHYYGDVVRRLFLAGGVLMLVSFPFLQFFVPIPIFGTIVAILIVALGAGLIVPTQRWTMVLDMFVATVAMLGFEYYASRAYVQSQTSFFIVNQILAIIFFIAFYYSIKTVRGAFSGK